MNWWNYTLDLALVCVCELKEKARNSHMHWLLMDPAHNLSPVAQLSRIEAELILAVEFREWAFALLRQFQQRNGWGHLPTRCSRYIASRTPRPVEREQRGSCAPAAATTSTNSIKTGTQTRPRCSTQTCLGPNTWTGLRPFTWTCPRSSTRTCPRPSTWTASRTCISRGGSEDYVDRTKGRTTCQAVESRNASMT